MFKWGVRSKSNEVSACVWADKISLMRGIVDGGRLSLVALETIDSARLASLKERSAGSRLSLILLPQDYSFGVVALPPVEGAEQLREAIRWAYAKDSEISMDEAEFEVMQVSGSEDGGGLLRASAWVFAIEKVRLSSILTPLLKAKVKISAVDVLALAQRNLAVMEMPEGARAGAYASLVIGEKFSALGIASLSGDLLFHKQLEWTQEALSSAESREKLVLDLQRNFGFFERRLSAVGVVDGVIFGRDAHDISAFLREALGGFDWRAASFGRVDFGATSLTAQMGGDQAWLLGALWREFT